jgi:hypothetical protein
MKKGPIKVAAAGVGIFAVGHFVWLGIDPPADDKQPFDAAAYSSAGSATSSDVLVLSENVLGSLIEVPGPPMRPSITFRPKGEKA